MISKYELDLTFYECDRCGTSLRVRSDYLYWFSGPDDPEFWCPSCEDLPIASLVGIPAQDLPEALSLFNEFTLRPVPDIKSGEVRDIEDANQLYRPYTKRSFLTQYQAWLWQGGSESTCQRESSVLRTAKFDLQTQKYTAECQVRIEDKCAGLACQFLQAEVIKPVDSTCLVIQELCQIQRRSRFGLCQTGDEAQILKWYLLLTGGIHCPMLIPQPSVFSGERRPDFLCYIPVSRRPADRGWRSSRGPRRSLRSPERAPGWLGRIQPEGSFRTACLSPCPTRICGGHEGMARGTSVREGILD